jgi:hypothetical protein
VKAVVVGAGHNGLVAACYLARAGVDVTVLERDAVVGGAVSTVERWPGYRVDRGSSAHVMVRHTGIVEDLALDVTYQDLDPWGWTPYGDITFHVDLDRTCESIEKACGTRDADAYRAFALDWGQRNAKVFEAFQGPPTPGRLGRAIWGAGKGTGLPGIELARQFLTSGDALLDSLFDDERLKTALAWMGSQSGPPTHEPATADLVGWNTVMHRLAPGHPVGGSGALSVALQRRRTAGGCCSGSGSSPWSGGASARPRPSTRPTSSSARATSSRSSSLPSTRCSTGPAARSGSATASAWWCASRPARCRRTRARRRTARCSCSPTPASSCDWPSASTARGWCPRTRRHWP